ncbi:RnfABCDGE type electron transport complex subunit D, partial [Nanoarchaeota archaeon]
MEKLTVSVSPHIRDEDNVNKIMWYVVLALIPTTIAGIIFFKARALTTVLLSIIAAVLTEFIIQKLTNKKITIKDGSAVLTGLLLALVLSPLVPWWIPIIGAVFAIAIAKHAFGGLGHNIFNPALAGRAFLVASWPALMTAWLLPDGVTGATPLGMLKLQGTSTNYMQLFLGNIGGCIGEVSAIALLLGAAFLFYKKVIDWRIPAAYLGTVAVFALIFRQDPVFHLLSGGLLIGAFFMATDYVTSSITPKGKLWFGFGCGFLTIIFRLFSGYPEGVMFSILLMNAVTPLVDRYTKTKPFGF